MKFVIFGIIRYYLWDKRRGSSCSIFWSNRRKFFDIESSVIILSIRVKKVISFWITLKFVVLESREVYFGVKKRVDIVKYCI